MRSIHHHDGHLGWNASLEPDLRIAPGDEVELVLADAFGGQLAVDATAEDVAALDLARANPLTGPIAVEGARPGDALVVEILDVEPAEAGWTAIITGFGLLADDFPDPHLVRSDLSGEAIAFGDLAVLPRRPFLGTLGVAPAEPGTHDVIPPRRVGGNMDCRDIGPGARLFLPVEVEGALLSAGDAHGVQGDGEVCGTAVETSALARLRIDVVTGAGTSMRAPRVQLPPRDTRPRGERWVTMGVATDLHRAAQDATREMIELLGRERHLDAADAYALCSVAADLRVVEVVDAPNWVVGCEIDPAVLDAR